MPLLINQQSMKRMMMNGRWPNDSSIITWARPWLRWRYLSKTSKQLTQNFLQQQTMTTVSQSIITLSRLQSMSIIYIAPIVEGWVWGAGVWVTRRDRQRERIAIIRGRYTKCSRGNRIFSTVRNSKKMIISRSQTSRWLAYIGQVY